MCLKEVLSSCLMCTPSQPPLDTLYHSCPKYDFVKLLTRKQKAPT